MERLFISRQSRHSDFDAGIHNSTFPYLYFDFACEHFCFRPRRRHKQEKRKNKKHNCYYYFVVLMIITSIVNSLIGLFETVKKPRLIFLQQKDNQVLIADQYFSRRNWQLSEIRRNLQH